MMSGGLDRTHRLIAIRPRSITDYDVHTYCRSYPGLKTELRMTCAHKGFSHWVIFNREGKALGMGVIPGYSSNGWEGIHLLETAKQEFEKAEHTEKQRNRDPLFNAPNPTVHELTDNSPYCWKSRALAVQLIGLSNGKPLDDWRKKKSFIDGYHYRHVNPSHGKKLRCLFHIARCIRYYKDLLEGAA